MRLEDQDEEADGAGRDTPRSYAETGKVEALAPLEDNEDDACELDDIVEGDSGEGHGRKSLGETWGRLACDGGHQRGRKAGAL